MQHNKPRSMETLGIEHFLTPEQYAIFIAHVDIANRRKLAEKMGIRERRLYRILKAYRNRKEE